MVPPEGGPDNVTNRFHRKVDQAVFPKKEQAKRYQPPGGIWVVLNRQPRNPIAPTECGLLAKAKERLSGKESPSQEACGRQPEKVCCVAYHGAKIQVPLIIVVTLCVGSRIRRREMFCVWFGQGGCADGRSRWKGTHQSAGRKEVQVAECERQKG